MINKMHSQMLWIAIRSLQMPIYVELRENCAFIPFWADRMKHNTFMRKMSVSGDSADDVLQKCTAIKLIKLGGSLCHKHLTPLCPHHLESTYKSDVYELTTIVFYLLWWQNRFSSIDTLYRHQPTRLRLITESFWVPKRGSIEIASVWSGNHGAHRTSGAAARQTTWSEKK